MYINFGGFYLAVKGHIHYKYKNQLKITEVSMDGGTIKYTNKGSRENVRQVAPYSSFSSNCVSMKNVVRGAPCLTFSLLHLFVYFFVPPSLLL